MLLFTVFVSTFCTYEYIVYENYGRIVQATYKLNVYEYTNEECYQVETEVEFFQTIWIDRKLRQLVNIKIKNIADIGIGLQ